MKFDFTFHQGYHIWSSFKLIQQKKLDKKYSITYILSIHETVYSYHLMGAVFLKLETTQIHKKREGSPLFHP